MNLFFGIIDSIVHYNSNQHEYESYATDLNDGNYENNFNTVIASTSIKEDHINSGYIYSDINNEWQNPTLCLLFVVVNIKLTVSTSD